jgi:hypothetical protein
MSKMDAIEVRIYGCENRKEGGWYEGRNRFWFQPGRSHWIDLVVSMDGDWSGLRLLYGGIQNLVALAAAPCCQPQAESSQLDPCFGVGWIVQNLVRLKPSILDYQRQHLTDLQGG